MWMRNLRQLCVTATGTYNMEEYLKLLKRRLVRSAIQMKKRMHEGSPLSHEGVRMVGYYQGRISILEDAIDEIEDFINKEKL